MKRHLLALAILCLAALVVYGTSLQNPFVHDDEIQIVHNEFVHNFDLKSLLQGSTFAGFGQDKPVGVYYKPLLSVVYAALWNLGAGNSLIFHLLQTALAVANSFFFFLLLRLWVRPVTALLTALIFLLHPINSEVVLYVADMQDTLYMFWGLLALLCIQYLKSWWLTISCLVLSILSKETGLLFVVLAPIYILFVLRRPWRNAALVSFCIFAAYCGLRVLLGVTILSTQAAPMARSDFLTRLISFPQSVAYYIKTFFWPQTLYLNQNWVLNEISFQSFWRPILIMSAFAAALGFLFKTSKDQVKGIMLFCLAALLLTFGLHSNLFVPLDVTAADRWFYLGSLGLLGFLAVSLDSVVKSGWWQIACAIVLVCALSWRSFVRSQDWSSGLTLFAVEFEKSPSDAGWANGLGMELYRANRLSEAEKLFSRAVVLDPQGFANWNNLGIVAERNGKLSFAETYYAHSINNGQYPPAIENYMSLLFRMGRYEDLKKFLPEALLRLPHNQKLLDLEKQMNETSR